MANVKIEDYQERRIELAGWPVNLTSYRMGREWHCKADNVSPGAALCRTTGETRDDAERKAIQRAEQLLASTKRHAV